jgi:hypothetical protein
MIAQCSSVIEFRKLSNACVIWNFCQSAPLRHGNGAGAADRPEMQFMREVLNRRC